MRNLRAIMAVAVALALAGTAWGQAGAGPGMTFSVDFQGPMAGKAPGAFSGGPDSFGGVLIDEGSILTPFFPGPPGPNPSSLAPIGAMLAPPGVMVTGVASPLGTVPGGLGLLPNGPVELDALSYGRDHGNEFLFSVDEFAVGIPGSPVPPNVFTEGPMMGGPAEASADVFKYTGGPVPAFVPVPVIGNTAVVDGNGIPPSGMRGVGLIEPNPPFPGIPFDPGDNLDAVDMNTTMNDVMGSIYFSLDSRFLDPLEGPPANSGTAVANGFSGGDVLVSFAGGVPAMYAPAGMLGLDLVLGFDTDDLDALALLEDGDGVFRPAMPMMREVSGDIVFMPVTLWAAGGDLILFSVRRGSAVIGMPDSAFGAPIEESDILTVPVPLAAGGLSLFPAIVVPGEALGLWTLRSSGPNPIHGMPFGDDLDALDLVPEPTTMTLLALGACLALRRRRRR